MTGRGNLLCPITTAVEENRRCPLFSPAFAAIHRATYYFILPLDFTSFFDKAAIFFTPNHSDRPTRYALKFRLRHVRAMANSGRWHKKTTHWPTTTRPAP